MNGGVAVALGVGAGVGVGGGVGVAAGITAGWLVSVGETVAGCVGANIEVVESAPQAVIMERTATKTIFPIAGRIFRLRVCQLLIESSYSRQHWQSY